MRHFLRLTRHAHTSSHVAAIAAALGTTVDAVTVHTQDVGDYGTDPRETISAHIRGFCLDAGHDLDGVEVTAPPPVLVSLGRLPASRYVSVMARGADGRVLVQLDESGAPVRGADGRDVLVVARYERVAWGDGSIHVDGREAIQYDSDGRCDCDGSHRSECTRTAP